MSVPRPRLPRLSLPRPSLPAIGLGRPSLNPHQRELVVGTLKAGIALAAVAAVAVAVGTALGLPSPLSSDDADGELASSASGILVPLDQGTEAVSSQGPFHPVLAPSVDYGEFAARFGGGRGHPGQDMFAPVGTPLVAVRPGIVVDWGAVDGKYSGGRGNYLGIFNAEDDRTYNYLHMKQPSPLRVGDTVAAGQVVGLLGCTGYCDGPHLHFEIRLGRDDFGHDPKPIDPLPFLKRWPHAPTSPAPAPAPASPAPTSPAPASP